MSDKIKRLEEELSAHKPAFVKLTLENERLSQDLKIRSEELDQTYAQLNTTNLEVLSKHEKLKDTLAALQKTQSQLVQSEKLASLGVFTAGIAHEINNPVNYITSASAVLFDIIEHLNAYPEALEEKMSDILYTKEAIEEGIERTVAIISSLRNYANSDQKEFVRYDLVSCLENTLSLLHNIYKYHVKIEKDLPESMEIECIPGRLNQVFVNLISNAADAIEGEGTIKIKGYWREDTACLEVTDSGAGIEEEHLSQIFDPFFTTKEVGKGTGLGLYVVHGIIKQHKGEIQVTSDAQKGTTFSLTLPKTQPAQDDSRMA